MNRHKLLVPLAALAALLLAIGALAVYRVEDWTFHYITMPPTDDSLRQWLTAQPGVEDVEVWRIRAPQQGREVDKLRIRYRVRFWRKGPDLPEVTSAGGRLGYKQPLEIEMDKEGIGWGW
jgi:hypothetical protein